MPEARRSDLPGKDFFSPLPSSLYPPLSDLSPRPPKKRVDVSRERVEISCLARFLLMPEARRSDLPGKDFFSPLPSSLYPPLSDLSPRPPKKRVDVSRERVEISCLARFLL
ncbi:MAG: hypothetical protein OXH06_00135, partial [Gemmatimonadetes bacterium]|nr:hypothetical protein [Gemmatimonadota bacterium]